MPSKRRSVIDEAYRGWIAQKRCWCCELEGRRQVSRTEVAHVGLRGLGQKCSDRQTMPLCNEHHTGGKFAHHKLGKRFWDHWGIDRDEVIAQLNGEYEERRTV